MANAPLFIVYAKTNILFKRKKESRIEILFILEQLVSFLTCYIVRL